MAAKIRFLSANDLAQCLPMADAIAAMRTAFIELSAGRVDAPPRAHLTTTGGDALFMPCYSSAIGRLAHKTITLTPANRLRGLAFANALVTLFDAGTGVPLAVMDGGALTAIRTGAACGLATDLLARADAHTVAIFGAGVQARTQLEAVCAVRPIREARVYSPAPDAVAFAAAMSGLLGLPVIPCASPVEALDGADVVTTATVSRSPVFDDADLADGVHLNAIGSYKPDVREVPGETVRRALVVVDHRPAALEEAGDLLIPMAEGWYRAEMIHAELGEVACGSRPGRATAEQVTFFKSVGVAVQDLAAADAALANAERMGLGTVVDL